MSFRGDAKHRTRNLEIPRCAIAHPWSGAGACHRAALRADPVAPSRNDVTKAQSTRRRKEPNKPLSASRIRFGDGRRRPVPTARQVKIQEDRGQKAAAIDVDSELERRTNSNWCCRHDRPTIYEAHAPSNAKTICPLEVSAATRARQSLQ